MSDAEHKYTIKDLFTNAVEQKPLEFADAFDAIMTDRLADALTAKREQIASGIVSDEEEEND